ncbi:Ribonuclease H-like domain containing protein [Trema orientale]|uniref:Ribonuclease H-like domain containing protein n=1 Tax=Trema orientale TaxID=63057 RepID=A0A2P5APU8_TREOI|nr:Ribonuclease H-like domain containing protein [Trema orientale]
MWAKIFAAKYYPRGTFWSSTLGKNASVVAKGIWSTREFLKKESWCLIGEGDTVDLWNAPWIPWDEEDASRASFNLIIYQSLLIAEQFLLERQREWNLDRLTWLIRPEFLLRDCPDSIQHLLFSCSFTRAIWFGSKWSLRTEHLGNCSNEELVKWILKPPHLDAFDSGTTLEFTWFAAARNTKYHSGKVHSPERLLTWINKLTREHLNNQAIGSANRAKAEGKNTGVTNCKDLRGRKAMVDASFKNGMAISAVIGIDEVNEVKILSTCYEKASSPIDAELWGLLLALQVCSEVGWQNSHILMDSNEVVRVVVSRNISHRALAHIFFDVFNLLDAGLYTVKWTPRSHNVAAHELAKWAFGLKISGNFKVQENMPNQETLSNSSTDSGVQSKS